MRTIRITGRGQFRMKPDMTRIVISLEGICPDYADALRSSAKATERLRKLVEELAFNGSDLKTLSFNVDTEYESYKEHGSFKQRLVGYKFHQVLKIEFESDNVRLGKVLYALANCELKPEFQVSYTLKDPEKAKNKLLGEAVADARKKAEVLTRTAGVGLKDIQSIDYSWGQVNLEVHPMNRMLAMEDCMEASSAKQSFEMAIEPDDVELTDTVTIIWEIG